MGPLSARFGELVVSFDPATGTGCEEAPGVEPLVATGLADLARVPVLRPPPGPPRTAPPAGDAAQVWAYEVVESAGPAAARHEARG